MTDIIYIRQRPCRLSRCAQNGTGLPECRSGATARLSLCPALQRVAESNQRQEWVKKTRVYLLQAVKERGCCGTTENSNSSDTVQMLVLLTSKKPGGPGPPLGRVVDFMGTTAKDPGNIHNERVQPRLLPGEYTKNPLLQTAHEPTPALSSVSPRDALGRAADIILSNMQSRRREGINWTARSRRNRLHERKAAFLGAEKKIRLRTGVVGAKSVY